MNDRIGKLCEQSKLYADNCTKDFTGDEPVVWMDYYTEKFAQLIVLECAELVESQHTWVTSVAASALIRKHFGVE